MMDRSSKFDPEKIRHDLCNAFCGAVNVRPVASGLAVSSAFEDNTGDRISFFLTETLDGIRIEDDGSYLAQLVARGITIDQGTRSQLLDAILSQAHAHWDKETYEIKSTVVQPSEVASRSILFLSSLMRVRDLELFTRENVRSTFREDAIAAISSRFGERLGIQEDAPISDDFSEYPADLVLKSTIEGRGRSGAVYFVNSNDKLNEALLLKMESTSMGRDDFAIIALIEEPDMTSISRRRFQRAQNRSLAMPIFRGDEDAAMKFIGRELRIAA